MWQANQVKLLLEQHGYQAVLVPVKSEGDMDQVTPLYQMGVQGVFTRSLDAALLANHIDLAVHSMKDVPVQLANGLVQCAVLPRGNDEDVVVYKGDSAVLDQLDSKMVIATSSIRRQAQWLHRYPNTRFENLRGNIGSRLHKLVQSNWHGAIFAKAGLERINLLPPNHRVLHWMLPAPAQGAIMVVCREDDSRVRMATAAFNDEHTEACTTIEREFLKALLGGCSLPISALASHHFNHISFMGNICMPDGSQLVEVSCTFEPNEVADAGFIAAQKLLANGGAAIMAKMNA
jgi:hydroxymethylbilane synthase